MSKSLNTLMTALMLAGAGNSFAASSVDLAVKGLITPSACVPQIANGGTFDIGKLSAKDLSFESPSRLEKHTTRFNVTCESATLIALKTQDNRVGSAYQDQEYGSLGLGLINGNQKLGFFYVYLDSPLADGVPARIIESFDGGPTWEEGGALRPTSIASVADSVALAPIPVQSLITDMLIAPFIAPTKTLTLTEEVPIDGSATVTVIYL